jgi:hypothetical protein
LWLPHACCMSLSSHPIPFHLMLVEKYKLLTFSLFSFLIFSHIKVFFPACLSLPYEATVTLVVKCLCFTDSGRAPGTWVLRSFYHWVCWHCSHSWFKHTADKTQNFHRQSYWKVTTGETKDWYWNWEAGYETVNWTELAPWFFPAFCGDVDEPSSLIFRGVTHRNMTIGETIWKWFTEVLSWPYLLTPILLYPSPLILPYQHSLLVLCEVTHYQPCS